MRGIFIRKISLLVLFRSLMSVQSTKFCKRELLFAVYSSHGSDSSSNVGDLRDDDYHWFLISRVSCERTWSNTKADRFSRHRHQLYQNPCWKASSSTRDGHDPCNLGCGIPPFALDKNRTEQRHSFCPNRKRFDRLCCHLHNKTCSCIGLGSAVLSVCGRSVVGLCVDWFVAFRAGQPGPKCGQAVIARKTFCDWPKREGDRAGIHGWWHHKVRELRINLSPLTRKCRKI